MEKDFWTEIREQIRAEEEKKNCFGETKKEEEARRRAGERKRGRGVHRGKEKPPWRPLGISSLNFVPKEAWAVHGEEPQEMDTGILKPSPYVKKNPFTSFVAYAADELDRQNGNGYDNTEDEREMNRDPEWDSNNAAQAGVALMIKLNLTPTREMCNVVGAYLGRLECRMDGAIHYCLENRRNNDVVEAALEFAEKMGKYLPEISKKAKNRLIADAQMERQLQRRVDGPAYRLGKAIFNSNWDRLLRATV